jgi:hypothetical protein
MDSYGELSKQYALTVNVLVSTSPKLTTASHPSPSWDSITERGINEFIKLREKVI